MPLTISSRFAFTCDELTSVLLQFEAAQLEKQASLDTNAITDRLTQQTEKVRYVLQQNESLAMVDHAAKHPFFNNEEPALSSTILRDCAPHTVASTACFALVPSIMR